MHAAPAFRMDDQAEMTAFLEARHFATLVVSGAITGVRLTIDAIEGIAKLSQNRPEDDRAGVLNGFTHSPDPAARQLAARMIKEA